MNNTTITDFIKNYRLLLIAGGLLLVLVVAGVLAFTDWLGTAWNMHQIKKIEQNINGVNVNNNSIRENLNGLYIENRLQQEEVNRLAQNYNAAKEDVNQQRNTIRETQENLNRMKANRAANVNMRDAMKALCDYNPNAEGCH